MNKLFSYLGILVLVSFSFFYTEKATDIIKRNDPLMKKIIKYKDNYKVESVNGEIIEDTYKVGYNGCLVDINKTYNKMKSINKYDENLIVFKELLPVVSISKNLDKYVIGSNRTDKKIALVFKIDNLNYYNKLNSIIVDKNINATLFIDNNIIENN